MLEFRSLRRGDCAYENAEDWAREAVSSVFVYRFGHNRVQAKRGFNSRHFANRAERAGLQP